MISSQLRRFIQRIPKAELHVHLEGTIQLDTVLDLAKKHGVELPVSNGESFKQLYDFTSLDQFIGIMDEVVGKTLKDADDYRRIVVELAADSKTQNILYQEVFFTIIAPGYMSVPTEAVVEGLARGRKEAWEKYGVEIWFISDILRNIEPEGGLRVVDVTNQAREKAGIIGIGLDASEKGHPASKHKLGFDRARELGFRLVAHAGEEVGPESVRDAIDSLGVERIDHGVRSIEDPSLVELLVEMQIPLTICPVSNIALKVYPEMKAHPIKRLMDAGVFVTVNSDDPPMFHANLTENYLQVAEAFNLTVDEIIKLARNSFLAAFMDPVKREAYLNRFNAEVYSLRKELFPS
jgi:adenosine deaminase